MERAVRVCFFNTDDTTGKQIRDTIVEMPSLVVVLEAAEWEDLSDAIKTGKVDLVVANLEPDLGEALLVVQQITRVNPGIGVVGISQSKDPQAIIAAMRAGCSQFVCAPVEPDDLESAVDRIQATRKTVVHTSRRICLVGSSGGVGVTTLACNLAMELTHLTDRPSALIDLNLEFGDVACAFDCKPAYSVADLCSDDTEIDRTMVEAAMHVLPCNVHLLPRPERIESAHQVAPEGVTRLLDTLATIYPNVVIDLPRGMSFFSAAAVDQVDLILIVAQLSVSAIRNATRIYELLLQMNADPEKIEIVLNRCKADFEKINPDDVESHFRKPIFAMIPNDYRRVRASQDFGQPILVESPNSPARMAISELAKKITTELHDEEASPSPRKGLFGRLWSKKEPNG
ncbi:MAG: MinD/ParA family protein [bacterium]|nr:MinD/ParA family protein [bacterium]